jgi:hypothetical protein
VRNSIGPDQRLFAAKSGNDRGSRMWMFSSGVASGRRTGCEASKKTVGTATASCTATNWQASRGTFNRPTGKGWMMKVPISSAAAYRSASNASPLNTRAAEVDPSSKLLLRNTFQDS